MTRIGYARISTTDQDASLQHEALKSAGCSRIFTDQMSGKYATRPELDACLDYLRAGDTLVIWRLDRLGRSVLNLQELAALLQGRGIELVSLTEQFDTSTPAGRMLFSVLSAVAEFERDLVSERTRAGLQIAAKSGRKGGRARKLTDADVELARTRISNGETVGQAAKAAGVSRVTLYRYLEASA